MRGVNRSAVLEIIRTQGPISRTKIANILQVSLPTVMRVIEDLMKEKLVRINGKTKSSGGRKRLLFEFNAHEHLVVGVDMRVDRLYGAIVDLSGEILCDKSFPNKKKLGIEVYDPLEQLISELLGIAYKTNRSIRGIGVGAPGITYYDEGVVKWVPTLEWRDFPLTQKLTDSFNLPVIFDNDVNLSALGEMWFGVGKGQKNLVYILIDQGIGAGIIIDGEVYRGSHLTAGEIGFLLPDTDALNEKWKGIGATESIASVPGIIRRAEEVINYGVTDLYAKELTIENIFAAYQAGELWSQPVIDSTIDILSQIVGTVSVCFDPDVIVISGEVAKFSDIIIKKILERLKSRVPLRPKLLHSTLSHKAPIMGIVINVLHKTSDFYVVRKLR